MMNIAGIDAVNLINQNQNEGFGKPVPIITEGDPGQKTFSEFVSDAIQSVDEAQKTAAHETEALIMGKTENVHDVMIAMEKAQLSFNMMVEVRNRVVETYKELSRMPI